MITDIDALLINLRAEVLAITLHVADAVDVDIIGLPAVGFLAQLVVDGDAVAVVTLDLGTHGGAIGAGSTLRRKHLQPVGGEVGQRAAVVAQTANDRTHR